jgi:hypothetical protein
LDFKIDARPLTPVTAVENDWIAGRLAMGHPASMSQLVHRMRRDPKASKQLKKHEKTLKT